MSLDSYKTICDKIYQELLGKIERVEDELFRFAPRGTAREVLHDDSLRLFYRSLVSPKAPSVEQLCVPKETFVEAIKERGLHDFLATLIFGACSIDAARKFANKLVARYTPDESDLSLPADREEIEDLFENARDANNFLAKQACFCTVVLRQRQEVKVQTRNQCVPYLDETEIGQGSFGKVFKVTIAKGHFHFYDSISATFKHSTEPREMARKDYVLSNKFPAREEREIMEKILSSSTGCDNIVGNFGSLEVDGTYSLFMPLAICDLRKYMMEVNPTNAMDKPEIIQCAEGLSRGLDFLHHRMKTAEMDDLVCYHMDLMPSNVLIFREYDHRRGRMQNVWKLSDFGMSRVKVRKRGQGVERERDFTNWFIRRREPREPSLSAVPNQRAEGTYLAPESISATPSMKTESDVWSLGCVISVVFAYLEDGSRGVTSYENARQKHRESDDIDRFFLRGTMMRSTRLHPEVTKYHTYLIEKAAKRNSQEGDAARNILRQLENSVLQIERDRRCGATEVVRMLQRAYVEYRGAEAASKTGVPRRMSTALAQPFSWENVHEWYLPSSKGFKGCAISSKATVVAYWSDTTIQLYSSYALSGREGHEITPSAEYSLREADGFWKSVSLTSSYVVACTTRMNSLYIFDLAGGTPVDLNFQNIHELNRVKLPVPEIYRVAISPNSKHLACVLRNPNEVRGPAAILHARISAMVKRAGWLPNNLNDCVWSSGGSHAVAAVVSPPPWELVPLEWPAADVDRLSISDDRVCHAVIRPELTARSREHTIPIVRMSIPDSTIDTLKLTSGGFESRGPVGLFTAFAPFSEEPVCAAVTREKRLHIERFDGVDASRDLQRDVRNYRILKLMLGGKGGIVALGTKSSTNKIQVMEMAVPRPGEDIRVQDGPDLPRLSYGDYFTEVLFEEDGETYVFVATLGGANQRRTIYRVKL